MKRITKALVAAESVLMLASSMTVWLMLYAGGSPALILPGTVFGKTVKLFESMLGTFFIVGSIALVVSLPFLALGILCHSYFTRAKIGNASAYVLLGIGVALLYCLGVALISIGSGDKNLYSFVFFAAPAFVSGPLASFVFWKIAVNATR